MGGGWNWLRIVSSDGLCISSAECFATSMLNYFSSLVIAMLCIVASFLDGLAP